MAEMGLFQRDALNESISLELDMLNILYVVLVICKLRRLTTVFQCPYCAAPEQTK